jgi:hypothetical protein
MKRTRKIYHDEWARIERRRRFGSAAVIIGLLFLTLCLGAVETAKAIRARPAGVQAGQ